MQLGSIFLFSVIYLPRRAPQIDIRKVQVRNNGGKEPFRISSHSGNDSAWSGVSCGTKRNKRICGTKKLFSLFPVCSVLCCSGPLKKNLFCSCASALAQNQGTRTKLLFFVPEQLPHWCQHRVAGSPIIVSYKGQRRPFWMSVDTLIVHYLRSLLAKFHVAIVIPSSTVAFLSCNRTYGAPCKINWQAAITNSTNDDGFQPQKW